MHVLLINYPISQNFHVEKATMVQALCHISIFILVLISNLTILSEGKLVFFPVRHVHIKNNLGDGINLQVHCKSGDDDLGIHNVTYGGDYQFHFRVNAFGTTLFFCGLVWDAKLHYLNAYIHQRDKERCAPDCFWTVDKNQSCLFNMRTRSQECRPF
ncbi:putative plant self-incompatibility S1 [Lupinus albus]|uniref:S-protein homolog n=1 Tax=Lupinus albus TaxID=3870 RepID=A0A6A4NSI4_LUPAL|nr:putative plant self-incompatibility S1 [Lupinus albus]